MLLSLHQMLALHSYSCQAALASSQDVLACTSGTADGSHHQQVVQSHILNASCAFLTMTLCHCHHRQRDAVRETQNHHSQGLRTLRNHLHTYIKPLTLLFPCICQPQQREHGRNDFYFYIYIHSTSQIRSCICYLYAHRLYIRHHHRHILS